MKQARKEALRFFLALLVGSFALTALGCAAFQKEVQEEVSAEFLVDLEEALSQAPKDELSKTYDPLSLLSEAEKSYEEENFIEATAEYEYFLDLHPLNQWASYAQYKLSLSHFHQIGSPDRDVGPVLEALTGFRKLLDLYPDNPFEEAAGKKIRACEELIAQREFYIGRFYYTKAAYPAAVSRFEGILKEYPDSQTAAQAMYYLALSYQFQGQTEKAVESLQEFLDKFPETKYRPEALRLLSELNGQT